MWIWEDLLEDYVNIRVREAINTYHLRIQADYEVLKAKSAKELADLKSTAFRRMVLGCLFCFAVGWILGNAWI